MTDPQDGNDTIGVINSVDDPEGASTSTVESRKFPTERLSYTMWILDQGAGHELDDCCGHRLR